MPWFWKSKQGSIEQTNEATRIPIFARISPAHCQALDSLCERTGRERADLAGILLDRIIDLMQGSDDNRNVDELIMLMGPQLK